MEYGSSGRLISCWRPNDRLAPVTSTAPHWRNCHPGVILHRPMDRAKKPRSPHLERIEDDPTARAVMLTGASSSRNSTRPSQPCLVQTVAALGCLV
ncbi:hypothetical protein BDV59DRAFT_59873 [Aspergillus ambiguus]|uniref:uncharacterized protein n=1 Tax=Aspergillus ambiguus TaxID=176160 RepID=UPI003CCD2623